MKKSALREKESAGRGSTDIPVDCATDPRIKGNSSSAEFTDGVPGDDTNIDMTDWDFEPIGTCYQVFLGVTPLL